MLRRYPWPHLFNIIVWRFGAFFDGFHDVISSYLVQWSQTLPVLKTSTNLTFGENLRSIRRQMCPQVQVISVTGQKIRCWKLEWGCHFGSNGPIYIFNFTFLCTVLFVCCCCWVFLRFFFNKKVFVFFNFLLLFLFIYLFFLW